MCVYIYIHVYIHRYQPNHNHQSALGSGLVLGTRNVGTRKAWGRGSVQGFKVSIGLPIRLEGVYEVV